MQRIRKNILLATLSGAACVSLLACQPKAKVRTMADFLHDIDAAHELLDKSQTGANPTEEEMNASAAGAKLSESHMHECYKGNTFTTANTDHACLDAKGYKRSE